MLLCSFSLKIFLFPLQAPQRSECPLAVSTERVFQNCSIKSKLQLCQVNAQNKKKFRRMLLCSSHLNIFVLALLAPQRSERPLAVSTERVFQSCSIKCKLQLCQLNAQNRKQFRRMLLCKFYLTIFAVPLSAPQRSECPLAVSTERVFQNCLTKTKVEHCLLNAQNRKKIRRIILCRLYLKIFLFPLQAPESAECPLAVSTERVFQDCSINSKVHLCSLNAQYRKKFRTILLRSFYLKIFLFPLQAPQRSETPLAVSKEWVFQNCSIKSKVQLCQLNAQKRKKIHRMLLCRFYLKIVLFHYWPLRAPNVHMQFLQIECLRTAQTKVWFSYVN